MKYILLILTISTLSLFSAHAQFKIGVKGGANISNVYLNETILNEGNITGFQVGPVMELMFHSPLGIDAAVLYSQQGLAIEDVDNNKQETRTNYINVPVNLKLKAGVKVAKFYFTAGPYVSFKISGDNSINGIYNQAMEQWKAETFQAGVNAGAGIEILGNIQIGANYEVGLTDNYSSKNFGAKNRTLSVTAAVFF